MNKLRYTNLMVPIGIGFLCHIGGYLIIIIGEYSSDIRLNIVFGAIVLQGLSALYLLAIVCIETLYQRKIVLQRSIVLYWAGFLLYLAGFLEPGIFLHPIIRVSIPILLISWSFYIAGIQMSRYMK